MVEPSCLRLQLAPPGCGQHTHGIRVLVRGTMDMAWESSDFATRVATLTLDAICAVLPGVEPTAARAVGVPTRLRVV